MKKWHIAGLVIAVAFIAGVAFTDDVKISTYYPAPYGVYNQMVVRTLGVGDANNDGKINYLDAPDPDPVNPDSLYVAGNIGIGTTSPQERVHFGSARPTSYAIRIDRNDGVDRQSYIGHDSLGAFIRVSDDNDTWSFRDDNGDQLITANPNTARVGIGTTNPGSALEVEGDIRAGAFFYSSDQSLKKNVKKIESGLEKIQRLQGVSFEWKEDGRKSLGLVAQDVEKVFPELVSASETTGLKSLGYGELVAPLVEALKEQQGQIEELNAKVERLEAKQN